jgi:hypothetical protein
MGKESTRDKENCEKKAIGGGPRDCSDRREGKEIIVCGRLEEARGIPLYPP